MSGHVDCLMSTEVSADVYETLNERSGSRVKAEMSNTKRRACVCVSSCKHVCTFRGKV